MRLKRKIVVGLATVGVLGSIGTTCSIGYYQNCKIEQLETQNKQLQKSLKSTKEQNKEYLSQMKDLTDQVNDINTLISEKTNWRIPTIKLGLCSSDHTWFKSFEPYQLVTDKSSPNYQLIHSDLIEIGSDGLLHTTDGKDYIGVAMGTVYGKAGDRFIIKFDNGNETRVIMLDEKGKGTVNNCYHASDGSMVEILVDKDLFKEAYPIAYHKGDLNYSDKFNGRIVGIEKVIE